jgi:GntR family carbon starvation induced transcriptional regulator
MTASSIRERPGAGDAPRRPPSNDDDSGVTFASLAYRQIRDDILSGALPPNQKLRMQDLRQRYDIGIAPLREALARLRAEQLVIASDNRGFWVAPVSTAELRDLTQVRMLLEGEALRCSIRDGDDAWEAAVVAAYHFLARVTERGAHLSVETLPEWEARHEDFHRALISGAASGLLLRLRSMLTLLVHRYRRFAIATAMHRPHLEEHREIMDAALARDADRAVEFLARHYDLTTQAILKRFGREVDA